MILDGLVSVLRVLKCVRVISLPIGTIRLSCLANGVMGAAVKSHFRLEQEMQSSVKPEAKSSWTPLPVKHLNGKHFHRGVWLKRQKVLHHLKHFSNLVSLCACSLLLFVSCLCAFNVCCHKRTAWGCRGCGRIPNAGTLAISWAKIFNIWANYTATFTFTWGRFYVAFNGTSFAETILPFFASDGKIDCLTAKQTVHLSELESFGNSSSFHHIWAN